MRTLLIDGDIFAYQIACTEEHPVEFDGMVTLTADIEQGEENLTAALVALQSRLDADQLRVAITPTNDQTNFRRAILPTYKQHRDGARRPMILDHLKQHLIDNHGAVTKHALEADDILGIWATNPKLWPGEKIIVTEDKDLRTIPGWHFNPKKDEETRLISPEAADFYHLYQTLIGDKADGYSGCPGIGPVKAERLLSVDEDAPLWPIVVDTFVKRGLTEADALVQAQVARICRHSDYDYVNSRPIPWRPN